MKKYFLDLILGALFNGILIFTIKGQALVQIITGVSPTSELTYLVTSMVLASGIASLVGMSIHRRLLVKAVLASVVGSSIVVIFAYWIISQLF